MKATVEELALAILIKKNAPIGQELACDELNFLRELIKRCRPDKVSRKRKIMSGRVVLHCGEDGKKFLPHRCLEFTMSNGEKWLASIMKLATNNRQWREANINADILIAHHSRAA